MADDPKRGLVIPMPAQQAALVIVPSKPQEAPKLCRDCRHAKRDPLLGWKYAKCRISPVEETIPEINPVSGRHQDTTPELYYCSVLRTSSVPKHCGAEAKYFEPRLTGARLTHLRRRVQAILRRGARR